MQYTAPDHQVIRRDDGAMVPCDQNNTDYAAIVPSGAAVAPYQPPSPTSDHVRREAHRRLCQVVGAVGIAHAALIIGDNERELRCLVEAGPGAGTRAAEIRSLDAAIEAVWTAYIAVPEPPPVDFAADARWG